MTRTKAEHPERKERLLYAAKGLMLDKGFVATSVDEICEAAGVTKGTFFHYFKSKEELGEELVERFAAHFAEQMREAACCAGDDPLDRFYGCVDLSIKMADCQDEKGCLLGTFVQEMHQSHPQIRKLCDKGFNSVLRACKADLAEARKKYAPKADIDVEGLAEHFVAITQGSMILMKAKGDRSIMKRTLTHYKRYLKSIFGR
ncbi:MAG: TetR/AcrR family transcriptional regulator [Nitrospinae bacterium]|nr:TetR/AcrR family transcriptional regulator [Nitrospinota bacterium]